MYICERAIVFNVYGNLSIMFKNVMRQEDLLGYFNLATVIFYAPINCKPHPPPGAHWISGGDLSNQICTILHIWGIAFLANPLQYPMFSPPTTLGIYGFC